MHYVMSDIHGDYEHFLDMLDEVDFDEDKDVLYIIGDVIDRGTENLEMLDFCMEHSWVTLLKGNHELFMETAGKDKGFARDWRKYGGKNTIRQLKAISGKKRQVYFDYVASLPWYLVITEDEVPGLDRPYLLTHTGFLELDRDRTDKYPDFVFPDLTGQEVFDIEKAVKWFSEEREWQYSISSDIYYIPEKVRFDKRLLVGHVPTMSGHCFKPIHYMLERREYIDLDCGAGYRDMDGRLGCLRLEDMKIWYI